MTPDSKRTDQGESAQMHPNPDVISQRLDDTMILLHLRTNRFYELSRTGARFWELLGDGLNETQIKERMMEEFEVDPDQLAREMDDLIHSLKKEDLLVAK